jgi:hypothetical protein
LAGLSRYRAAQASILSLQAQEKNTDKEMEDALAEMRRAIYDVLDTPIGAAHQFFSKFEVVEELITQEDAAGKSSANYSILAMASLKRDLLELNGKTMEL